MDYKSAGVDIDKGNRFAEKIKDLAKTLPDYGSLFTIGAFGALNSLEMFGCDLVLSTTTDGVGTKLLIAQMAGVHNTIGIDLVAMNVNDVITTGLKPVLFLDYIAYSDVEDSVLEHIIEGIVKGLKQSRCSLVGGETAQMPDVYKKGEYDLAGFCVGVGRKEDIMPRQINEGMIIVGFGSSGFHSNGYSLLRKVFFDIGGYKLDSLINGRPLADILLTPTRIYVPLIEKINKSMVALAHITGGGFYENIPRILGGEFDAIIEKKKLPSVDIFTFVQELGKIPEKEMFRTFNMGVGLVGICEGSKKNLIIDTSKSLGIEAFEIGFVKKGTGRVEIV